MKEMDALIEELATHHLMQYWIGAAVEAAVLPETKEADRKRLQQCFQKCARRALYILSDDELPPIPDEWTSESIMDFKDGISTDRAYDRAEGFGSDTDSIEKDFPQQILKGMPERRFVIFMRAYFLITFRRAIGKPIDAGEGYEKCPLVRVIEHTVGIFRDKKPKIEIDDFTADAIREADADITKVCLEMIKEQTAARNEEDLKNLPITYPLKLDDI